jgi:AmmeMemoRadiSam system protein B
MPSPVEDRPGLLIRDSFRYSDAVLIIPPQLVPCLICFDGEQTRTDLRVALMQATGELDVSALESQLIGVLSRSGFLIDETFHALKEKCEKEFAGAPVREPSHAGNAYPDNVIELRSTMDRWMHQQSIRASSAQPTASGGILGIAAPHVSPEGGYESYRAAYRNLDPVNNGRTFVVLGTSHYGAPERFGLTHKPYVTPWGRSLTDAALVDELTRRAPQSIATEDYCHAVEHSIEFQVLFLQSIFGADIRILPILCGSYAQSIYGGGKPEACDPVARFLDALGDIAAREGSRLCWVLGIDMAHMGRRYGDELVAIAGTGEMLAVDRRDQMRINRIAAGDADGFWELVQENHDDLKWCGSSPVYTFLKVMPQARGTLEKYEQWNIDRESAVSFAGMSFR